MTPLPCVITNGGPLIALGRSDVASWRGTTPPVDAEVPAGWTWGDPGVTTDYDRACTPPQHGFGIDDSYFAWPVTFGEAVGLVLDGEVGTSAIGCNEGAVIIREVGLMTEMEAQALLRSLDASQWIETGFDFAVQGGALILFDSAYPGLERHEADGGVLEVELAPARYRIAIAYPAQLRRTTLIRLARTSAI